MMDKIQALLLLCVVERALTLPLKTGQKVLDAKSQDVCNVKSFEMSDEVNITWENLWDIDAMNGCLDSVPISSERRTATLGVVLDQIQDVYAYNPWIKNSSASNDEITGCRNLEQHTSHLGPWMKEHLEHGGSLWHATSFGALWKPLTQFDVMIRDAHTNVIAPWYGSIGAVAPFAFVKDKTGEGWRIADWRGIRTDWKESLLDPAAVPHLGKGLQTINGVPPAAYMRKLVDLNVNAYKSAGARLNAFLLGTQELLSYWIPPDNGALHVQFSDGTQYKGAWKVFANVAPPTEEEEHLPMTERLSKRWSANALFDILNGAYDFATVKPMPIKRKKLKSPPGDLEDMISPHIGSTTHAEVSSAQVEGEPEVVGHISKVSFMQHSAEGDWAITRYIPTVPDRKYHEECSVSVAKNNVSGTTLVTWKLNGFMFPREQPRTTLLMAKLAVKLAAELSGGELIIDLLGNGGGSVGHSALLSMYFFGALSEKNQPLSKVCPVVDEKLSSLARALLSNTQSIAKMKAAALLSARDVAWYLQDRNGTIEFLESLRLKLDKSLHGFQTSVATIMMSAPDDLRNWAEDYGMGNADVEILKDFAKLALQSDETAYCISTLEDGTYNTGQLQDKCGIISLLTSFGFTTKTRAVSGETDATVPEIFYNGLPWPSTEVVNPIDMVTLQAWLNPQTLLRGGEWADYTAMYSFSAACPQYIGLDDLPEEMRQDDDFYVPAPQSMISNIKVLTDGTCGSACSQFVSRPYLTGAATMYTYGGFQDEAMDISAFNAGNVLSWNDVWKQHTQALLVSHAFVSPTQTPPAHWPPATGYFRYSYTAQRFPDLLGPRSTWREMYILPASHHLQYWMPPQAKASAPGNKPSFGWAELVHVYSEISNRPAKPFSCDATPSCASWCQPHSQKWETKCAFVDCVGCSECTAALF